MGLDPDRQNILTLHSVEKQKKETYKTERKPSTNWLNEAVNPQFGSSAVASRRVTQTDKEAGGLQMDTLCVQVREVPAVSSVFLISAAAPPRETRNAHRTSPAISFSASRLFPPLPSPSRIGQTLTKSQTTH